MMYEQSLKNSVIQPSAFVGYDDDVNNNRDPLTVKFNEKHLPLEVIEIGPYGVPREVRHSQYGESTIPYYGPNVTKI